MRRYRFGRIAAALAVGYAAVVVAAGVVALVTGDPTLLRRLVVGPWADPAVPATTTWVEFLLVAGGALQGWAYWQVLRGRRAGEPSAGGGAAGPLRAALYLSVAFALIFRLPIAHEWWWLALPGHLVQLAVVWLFFAVLAGVLPRWLRILALAAGTAKAALDVASSVASVLGAVELPDLLDRLPPGNLLHLAWLVPVLAGQARDPWWSRGTVRAGAVAASLVFLSPAYGVAWVSSGGEISPIALWLLIIDVLSVFGLVWAARSAHELAGPPGRPYPMAVPARAARRPWPLAAPAVVPPLLPAAVNLTQGMPAWIGPRGAVTGFFRDFVGPPVYLLWQAVDLLVGVGAPALLVLAAVVRRSERLLRGTVLALLLATAAGFVTVVTTESDLGRQPIHEPAETLRLYPHGLFPPNRYGEPQSGISPLWYSAALAASAFALYLLYLKPPAARPRRRVPAGAAGALTALCLLPAADHVRGPVTTVEDCAPERQGPETGRDGPAGARGFICTVRAYGLLGVAGTAPDPAVLAYGRRLCDVYTRGDPRELARIRSVHGVDVRELRGVLAGICPAADATVRAERAAHERELERLEAEERRKCAAMPRHRPRIRPVRAIRLSEPQWFEAGLDLFEDAPANAGDDRYQQDGLVTGGPGHLHLHVSPEARVCVTLETYARRPPVAVKGWHEVVEVGYHSPTGRMTFADVVSGTRLPDISLNRRKGHYRIRVHYAWLRRKGDPRGTQRLLIMAYPGPGDRLVTYRQRSRS
ncbi:hypothetical protein GCM10010106_21550 [Thermopolyspora flexuosa]|uniref:Uncharacterized protein n=1 Tax=Thermopolyspora flexuosa TaxID=103836 RepID=A0A543J360_9ACTN|nr:hypothetical protein [Thermopolyspora flexuosa]TQM77265.1 hypothetical protein FHX40_4022 [Thermopolyspora flexuosa]GGM74758.1 hypothetical protein GCM10010106_21550 [Thermopolyspora flexuosa]